MMKKMIVLMRVQTILVLTVILGLAGCSTSGEERPEYMDAKSVKNLEIPPKLSAPDTRNAVRIPEPSQMAQAASAQSNAKIQTIAPQFEGMVLKNNGDIYWLEIDQPVAEVWSSLKRFLTDEGIETVRVEKLMGFVDTKWMNEFEATQSAGNTSSWLSGFSPDYKDRFRLRVEATNEENKTRLYISHRGVQINVIDEGSQWVQRDSEALLEREMLYRYVLFSGASKAGANDLLAEYSTYQTRVNGSEENPSEFTVKGDADTIWLRLKVAMDRLAVDIVSADADNKTLDVLVGNITAVAPVKDDSGWFSGLFGKDIDVGDDEDYDSSDYVEPEFKAEDDKKLALRVQQISGQSSSTIRISFADGSPIKTGHARAFRDRLFEQLK